MGGDERLWAGEAGEALALFVDELLAASATLDAISGAAWPPVRAKSAGVIVWSSRSFNSFMRFELMIPMMVNGWPKTRMLTEPSFRSTAATSMSRAAIISLGRMTTLSSPGRNQRPAISARSRPETCVSSAVRPRTPRALWAFWPYFILMCARSEEHTSELQSRRKLVCRLLPEKKNPTTG